MNRIAVFVDAGYLYATGSEVLLGERQPRSALQLNFPALLAHLQGLAAQISRNEMLRIYWYDFSTGHLPLLDGVKLRSGFEPGERISGQIGADLTKLARNHAIGDALILAGDDELRSSVIQAQESGVRVHLVTLGHPELRPGRYSLRAECDTRRVFDASLLASYLAKRNEASLSPSPSEEGEVAAPDETTAASDEVLIGYVREHLSELYSDSLDQLAELGPRDPLPRELDGPLLVGVKRALGRPLLESEKRVLRDMAKRLAREPLSPGNVAVPVDGNID
jgi:hypothetical protein